MRRQDAILALLYRGVLGQQTQAAAIHHHRDIHVQHSLAGLGGKALVVHARPDRHHTGPLDCLRIERESSENPASKRGENACRLKEKEKSQGNKTAHTSCNSVVTMSSGRPTCTASTLSGCVTTLSKPAPKKLGNFSVSRLHSTPESKVLDAIPPVLKQASALMRMAPGMPLSPPMSTTCNKKKGGGQEENQFLGMSAICSSVPTAGHTRPNLPLWAEMGRSGSSRETSML